jgi:hypothetical protein
MLGPSGGLWRERSQTCGTQIAEALDSSPTKQPLQQRSGVDPSADGLRGVSTSLEPRAESLEIAAEDRKGRIAGVGPRVEFREHRDLLAIGAEHGAVSLPDRTNLVM